MLCSDITFNVRDILYVVCSISMVQVLRLSSLPPRSEQTDFSKGGLGTRLALVII